MCYLDGEMYLLKLAYKTFDQHFLKRYVRMDYKRNQTVLITMGYSFSLFHRILSYEGLTQVENTWCCSELIKRKTKPKESNKTTWYFRRITFDLIDGPIKHATVYENKKEMCD
jgi:hypothetical protein